MTVIPTHINFMPDEMAHIRLAADVNEMTVEEYIRYTAIVQAAQDISRRDDGPKTIDEPFGE